MWDKRHKAHLENILETPACVDEPAVLLFISRKAAIVELFHVVLHDKRQDIVNETFAEHDHAANAAVTILEGVDPLEAPMEADERIERLIGIVVSFEEITKCTRNLAGGDGCHAAYFVGQRFENAGFEDGIGESLGSP